MGEVYLLLPLPFPLFRRHGHDCPPASLIAQRCQHPRGESGSSFQVFVSVRFNLFHQQAMTGYDVIDAQHIYYRLITQLINISMNRYLTYHR